jgi:hypothetical protein
MFADKVMESCSITGTVAYALGGAVGAYRPWRSQAGDGATVFYFAQNQSATKWELGYGVLAYGSPDTLGRNLIASSSGALIAWAADDAPFYVFNAPVAFVMAALMMGQGFTARPAWAQQGLPWPDVSAGWSTRVIDKLFNGTKDIEKGRYEGVPGIYVSSPRRYWVDHGAAAYTATTNDVGKVHLFDVTGADRALTLPASAGVEHGFRMEALGYGSAAHNVVVTPDGTDKVDQGSAGAVLNVPGNVKFSIEWDGAKSQWRTSYRPQRIGGYLFGLTLSNNATTPNTKVDVAAGSCANDTGVAMLDLSAGTIDCGTVGANGLDAGILANSTTYHVFAIGKTDGTTALLASTSVSAPTMPTGYTLKRRIGSVITDGSAHVLAFVQNGDKFLWKASPRDVNAATLGATSTLYPLSVPTGLSVDALFRASATAAVNETIVIQSPLQNTLTASDTSSLYIVVGSSGNGAAGGEFSVMTDTSGRIRAVAAGNTTFNISTDGWIDRRGRDA